MDFREPLSHLDRILVQSHKRFCLFIRILTGKNLFHSFHLKYNGFIGRYTLADACPMPPLEATGLPGVQSLNGSGTIDLPSLAWNRA